MVLDVEVTRATGFSDGEAGLRMLRRSCRTRHRRTLSADKQYDTRDFVRGCQELGVTPHVAQNTSRRSSAIDGRTAGQEGYRVSQRIRKPAEEVFGWLKTVGGGRKLRYLGVRRNQLWAELAVTAFNLVRIGTLVAEPPERCSAVPGRPRPAAHTAPQPLVDVVTNAPTRLSSMPDDGKLLPRDLNSPRRRSSTPC